MRVTEELMNLGQFELTLRPDTPRRILQQMWDAMATWDSSVGRLVHGDDGQIVVFDTRTQNPSYESARYVGQIYARTGRATFTGMNLAAWLGDNNGIGGVAPPFIPGLALPLNLTFPIDMTSSTGRGPDIADWLTFVLGVSGGEGASATYFNGGLTFGTVTETGLTDMPDELPAEQGYLSAREYLDWACGHAGAEWRLNPDGTIDIGQAQYLFNTTPTVLLTDFTSGEHGGAVKVYPADIGYTVDLTQWANTVYVAPAESIGSAFDAGSDSLDPIVPWGYGYDRGGSPSIRPITRRKWVAPSNAPTAANGGDDLAESILNELQYPTATYSAATAADGIRRHLEPGDSVYVWSPDQGVEGDELVQAGVATFPHTVRCVGMSWNVTAANGVYFRTIPRLGPEKWVDLSDWVQFSSPGASLELIANEPVAVLRSKLTGGGRLGSNDVRHRKAVAAFGPNAPRTPAGPNRRGMYGL